MPSQHSSCLLPCAAPNPEVARIQNAPAVCEGHSRWTGKMVLHTHSGTIELVKVAISRSAKGSYHRWPPPSPSSSCLKRQRSFQDKSGRDLNLPFSAVTVAPPPFYRYSVNFLWAHSLLFFPTWQEWLFHTWQKGKKAEQQYICG